MKDTLMLPSRFRLPGLALAITGLAAGIAHLFFEWQPAFLDVNLPNWIRLIGDKGFLAETVNNLTDEIALTLAVAGLLIVAFSREPVEDEFIQATRLKSLQWAVLVNTILLLIACWLVYGMQFFTVLVFNALTVLLIFNLRFRWVLFRQQQKEEAL
jgi:uncharacterized membrane protein